ncbi:MAG TPA: thioesterase family protein [Polyangiaceae bacterium LLY-WYZ-15_(1-7)]|mgnify:CR=1 FL=1|nr:thioesterase [Myxococcales bacterium]MAT24236.1 thioesterase [Sandaracinus sp.]HJK91912.1 thioesterase family protein [Polyangiaceae bacterium LLY-WYZ-15_(1-7)]MBJ71932.1 thioesterase [Sandaracinus sp.]HJL03741.1 thioesterase family protein [Polyangiaceae bacterium LLY-WYZ-15_(1-7)]
MTAFDEAMAWREERAEDRQGGWEARFDEAWYQGRGAYGGVVAALFTRAFERVVRAGRQPRTLTVHFCAPATGSARLSARAEREGSYVSHLSGRLEQRGKTVAMALGTWGRDRTGGPALGESSRPDAPPPEDVPVLPWLPGWPTFAQRFEFRPCLGQAPMSGASEARLGGWIRGAEPQRADAAWVAALLDAWPPSALCLLSKPRPAASIDLSYHFFQPFPLDVPDDAFFLYDARSTVVQAGYAEERATLWDAEGRLVARVRQNVAII